MEQRDDNEAAYEQRNQYTQNQWRKVKRVPRWATDEAKDLITSLLTEDNIQLNNAADGHIRNENDSESTKAQPSNVSNKDDGLVGGYPRREPKFNGNW